MNPSIPVQRLGVPLQDDERYSETVALPAAADASAQDDEQDWVLPPVSPETRERLIKEDAALIESAPPAP